MRVVTRGAQHFFFEVQVSVSDCPDTLSLSLTQLWHYFDFRPVVWSIDYSVLITFILLQFILFRLILSLPYFRTLTVWLTIIIIISDLPLLCPAPGSAPGSA